MVYTVSAKEINSSFICDSRNFTMVYTKLNYVPSDELSAIAEI